MFPTCKWGGISVRLNLRDLLSLPYLEVKSFLPEDSEACGFNKVGEALDVSHVQMGRYLSAAEFARSALAALPGGEIFSPGGQRSLWIQQSWRGFGCFPRANGAVSQCG